MSKKIFKAFKETAEIATEELKKVFRDGGIMLVFFGACIIYPVLYGFIYKNESYRDLPVVVVDLDKSGRSRDFIRKIDATPELNVKGKVNSMHEAEMLYAKGEVFAIINIPETFSDDLACGRQTHVQGYCNMAVMMYYKSFYAGFNYVCMEVGLSNTINETVLSQGHALYNPTGGFSSFILPAVLVMIIQQTLVLGIGMLAGTSREENKGHSLIPVQRKYHKPQRVIWGKALAYFTLYLFISVYDLALIPYLFKLPHLIDLQTLFVFIVPYLFASVFFGMALSVFFWNRETPLLLYLCTSVPLLFISGLSWPGTHIHVFWKMISWFFPSTYAINGFIKLNTMGASVNQVAPELFAMWIQAGVYFIFTFFSYKLLIHLSERKIQRSALK